MFFRARRGNCCWCFFFFFAVLVNWSGCCFCFPSSIHFSQGHCSAWACVGQQMEGGEKKNQQDQLKETGFLQPKSDRLTDDHAWLLRSVSDPACRESWSKEGQSTVRTERTGWRSSRASVPSRLTLTHTVTTANLFVCLSEGGWKPGLWSRTDYLYGQEPQRSETLAAFVYSIWHPRALRKLDFTWIYGDCLLK